MKKTHEIYVKVEITAGSDSEAQKAGVILANRINGQLKKVERSDYLPF